MDIQIILLSPEWYSQTIEMIQRTIRISQKSIYPYELIEKFCHKYDLEKFRVKAQEIEYFIAIDNITQKVTGIIGLKQNELRTFFVDPQYQGQGIGRLLYNKLEQVAKDRKISKLFLYGSPLGEPAYITFGFTKVKTVKKEFEGVPYLDAYMEKELL
jgi:N-acetylglutamate synthase-like GNAT family acetyltransferase